MDDHKLVMITIFFQNMRKMKFFNENILGKFLGFGCMHENIFFFLKMIRIFFLKTFKENQVF